MQHLAMQHTCPPLHALAALAPLPRLRWLQLEVLPLAAAVGAGGSTPPSGAAELGLGGAMPPPEAAEHAAAEGVFALLAAMRDRKDFTVCLQGYNQPWEVKERVRRLRTAVRGMLRAEGMRAGMLQWDDDDSEAEDGAGDGGSGELSNGEGDSEGDEDEGDGDGDD